jgi:hypothetical protein
MKIKDVKQGDVWIAGNGVPFLAVDAGSGIIKMVSPYGTYIYPSALPGRKLLYRDRQLWDTEPVFTP